YAEAAQELGCPKGTLSIRLTRAREKLRHLLSRLGVSLPGGFLAALGEQEAAAGPPAAVVGLTVKAAGGACVTPARVTALVEGGLRALLLARLKAPLALLLALGLLAAGVLAFPAAAPPPGPASAPARAAPQGRLPAGVLARLGSTRLRHG